MRDDGGEGLRVVLTAVVITTAAPAPVDCEGDVCSSKSSGPEYI